MGSELNEKPLFIFSKIHLDSTLGPVKRKKPCTCNGETDVLGLGASCGKFCYVDEDADCDDRSSHHGKQISRALCQGVDEKTKIKPIKTSGTPENQENSGKGYDEKDCGKVLFLVLMFLFFKLLLFF